MPERAQEQERVSRDVSDVAAGLAVQKTAVGGVSENDGPLRVDDENALVYRVEHLFFLSGKLHAALPHSMSHFC